MADKTRIKPFLIPHQARCPLPFSISIPAVSQLINIIVRNAVADVRSNLPVFQVCGFQNRRCRHIEHGGGNHIEIVTHPYDIRIRHIRPEQWIANLHQKPP